MRNVCLGLILINLLVWAGLAWYVPERQPVSRYEGPGLTLARELEAAVETGLRLSAAPAAVPDEAPDPEAEGGAAGGDGAAADANADEPGAPQTDAGSGPGAGGPDAAAVPDAAAARAANGPAAEAASPSRCVAVGPFAEPEAAANAAVILAAAGLNARQRVAEQEIWEGYWVYIDRIESNAAANTMLASLTDNGIADAYIISRSDSGVLISLGVYSEIARAGTRAEQVSELGYEATISERTRMAEARWLELTLPGGESIDIDALRPPGRISRLEQRDCAQ